MDINETVCINTEIATFGLFDAESVKSIENLNDWWDEDGPVQRKLGPGKLKALDVGADGFCVFRMTTGELTALETRYAEETEEFELDLPTGTLGFGDPWPEADRPAERVDIPVQPGRYRVRKTWIAPPDWEPRAFTSAEVVDGGNLLVATFKPAQLAAWSLPDFKKDKLTDKMASLVVGVHADGRALIRGMTEVWALDWRTGAQDHHTKCYGSFLAFDANTWVLTEWEAESGEVVKLHDPIKKENLAELKGRKAFIRSMARVGDFLAVADKDGWVQLWDIDARTRAREWQAHQAGPTWAVSCGGALATTGADRRLVLWSHEGHKRAEQTLETGASSLFAVGERIYVVCGTQLRVFTVSGDALTDTGQQVDLKQPIRVVRGAEPHGLLVLTDEFAHLLDPASLQPRRSKQLIQQTKRNREIEALPEYVIQLALL